MLVFFITTEEQHRAQDRAAELDISKSEPPGRPPYVWDNRMGCVKRWYDYGSPEDRLGTIYFNPVVEGECRLSPIVECTTEVTHHPPKLERQLQQEKIADQTDHKKLVEFFFYDLLGSNPRDPEPDGSSLLK